MKHGLLLTAIAVALVFVAGAATARGQLQVRQTSVELLPGVRSARLVLANSGDAPVAAQVRLYGWTVQGEQDQLTPSNALVVSPAIVEVPAGGEQLVRLVRSTDVPPEKEEAYRVVVDELPGDPGKSTDTAVRVRMRYLLPMFVRAVDPAPTTLRCKLEPSAMICSNPGGRAAQLGASRLVAADGRSLELTQGLLGYIHAGGVRRFPIETSQLGKPANWTKLEVALNGAPETIELANGP